MKITGSFFAGAVLQGAIQFGIQSYLGKETYLEATRLLWTNEPWWLWLIFGVVAVAAELFVFSKER